MIIIHYHNHYDIDNDYDYHYNYYYNNYNNYNYYNYYNNNAAKKRLLHLRAAGFINIINMTAFIYK